MKHEQIKAVIAGIGPVIKEQLDSLRAENATLKAQNATLKAELNGEIAVLRAGLAQVSVDAETQRRELVELVKTFGLSPETMAAASRRLAS